MDSIFNDISCVFENDSQYFVTFDSILKNIGDREAELSNLQLFSLWEDVFKFDIVLDNKIKNSVGFQELANILKLEKDSLLAVEGELIELNKQLNQQLNEYNFKREEILSLLLKEDNFPTCPSGVSLHEIMGPKIKKYFNDLLRVKMILEKQQQLFN
ncbi:hypothetical protein ACQ4LE_003553 [Meloidogyne hapla]|uniref:Uncharacterized protein n=1 Tax=Meloidogyne hapla TaxID=6305 RepID=A0A1I8B8Q1_MELHA